MIQINEDDDIYRNRKISRKEKWLFIAWRDVGLAFIMFRPSDVQPRVQCPAISLYKTTLGKLFRMCLQPEPFRTDRGTATQDSRRSGGK